MEDREIRSAIRLRAAEPEDVEFIFRLENEGLKEGWTERLAPVSMESIRTFVYTCDPDPFACGQLRLICETEGGERVGLLDFYEISARHRTAKIGISVVEHLRNLGFGTAIVEAAGRYACRHLGLTTLAAIIGTENRSSRRVFEKSGYDPVGRLMGWWQTPTGSQDCCIYQKKRLQE